MKKNICILLSILCTCVWGQSLPAELYEKKMIVKASYVEFLKERYGYYHKDSLRNTIDYSASSFVFHADGTYGVYVEDTLGYEGQWALNAAKDSIYYEGRALFLVQLDAENLVYRTHTLQFADTSARLDTMYTYLHLTPAPVVTSIDDQQSLSAMTMFPNPVKNTLTIQVPTSATEENTIRLVSAYGQILREESLSSTSLQWDVQNLPKGMYYMQVLVDGRKRYAQVLIKE